MTSWRAEQFDLLPQSVAARWSSFGTWPDQTYFSNLVGIEVEELRRDYARMRLPWRAELNQPQGLMHGGAIATLIDTVVVPAIGTAYHGPRPFSTIELSVRYLAPVRQEDLVAEGWITRRGKQGRVLRGRGPDRVRGEGGHGELDLRRRLTHHRG